MACNQVMITRTEADEDYAYDSTSKWFRSDEILIELPQNYWVYNLPKDEIVESKFGNYKLTTEMSGKNLRVKRSFTLFKGDYSRSEYEEFNKFFERLESIERRKLVLNSKT